MTECKTCLQPIEAPAARVCLDRMCNECFIQELEEDLNDDNA